MSREQFDRLCAAFWPTAKSADIARRYAVYADGLSDVPPTALDSAIRRAVRELDRFPSAAKLREWATATIPKTTHRTLESDAPCQHCTATIEPTIKANGTPWRSFIRHTPECPQPHFSKPDKAGDGQELFWHRDVPKEYRQPTPREVRAELAQHVALIGAPAA